MKTIISVILDRSGSMGGKENDTIGGVNKFIEEQKRVPGECMLQLVRFDHEYEIFRPLTNLQYVEPMTHRDYLPRGNTALLDAVGRTINSLERDVFSLSPDRVIVLVITDGQENSSREFKREQIQEMIRARETSGRWQFIYFGADINAFSEAQSTGFSMSNTARYHITPQGMHRAYMSASAEVADWRTDTNKAKGNLGSVIPENDDQPATTTDKTS